MSAACTAHSALSGCDTTSSASSGVRVCAKWRHPCMFDSVHLSFASVPFTFDSVPWDRQWICRKMDRLSTAQAHASLQWRAICSCT